ncbi:MAG: hypothetical protein LLG01_00745 [Planctomycetaceae bacterium]|nr:hypothetical protein [Planctomycetaceae bacterium]
MFDEVVKMGFEPNANHVQRKFGNQPVTLEFDLGKITYHFRSKLEARYANYLERMREIGQILGWWYEPFTLRFAEGLPAEWTPDFLVLMPGGELELHETKGYIEQKDVHKFRRVRQNYSGFDKIVCVFAAESAKRPRVKAAASQWAEIRYANPLFKQVFGSTKACVE